MRHPATIVLLLVMVALLSWRLRPTPPTESAAATAAAPTHHPGERQVDYYLSGLHATTMGPDGMPARTLSAEHVRHFGDDDTTELENPRLTVHQGESPAWEVYAASGWISADGNLVLLDGEVQIDRAGGRDSRPVHIRTRNLRVQPRQDYAETDEQVSVRSDQDWIDATGMQAWLRQPSRIKFLADVKGFYAPPR